MEVGAAIAIGFAAASTVTLLVTLSLIRKNYIQKMEGMANALGIERKMASELEKEGQLPGALGLGRPVAISPKALEIFLRAKDKS